MPHSTVTATLEWTGGTLQGLLTADNIIAIVIVNSHWFKCLECASETCFDVAFIAIVIMNMYPLA